MKLFTRFVTTPLGVASGVIVLVLSILTVIDVLLRYIGGSSLPGAFEYSEVLLVIGVFFAFGAAQTDGTHVTSNVLTSRLKFRTRKIVVVIAAGITSIMLIVLVIATTEQAFFSIASGEYRFGLIQVPLWPAKVAVAIGMITFLFEFVRTYFINIPRETEEEYEAEVEAQLQGEQGL